ncbi:MAG: helix-turn-helix domain-containing protein [Coriobacteriia bacterium]|nr:helix-turn-helix domain-containing protein [Coriobacteriia bacterium]
MNSIAEKNERATLSGKYTTIQSADALGVSRHQVVQLIHAGELHAVRTAGDVFLVDAASVADYARLRQGKGRPFSVNVAWAALWLLSGLDVGWLAYQQRRRLRMRLNEMSAEEVVWAVRRRARLLRVRIDESFLKTAHENLVLSGVSSNLLSELGLTDGTGKLEGYLADRDLEAFMQNTFSAQDDDTNVILRVVGENIPFNLAGYKEMPRAVVATDLAASADVRERSAGLNLLEELLNEWRG